MEMSIRHDIEVIRQNLNMTLDEFAEFFGLGVSTLARYENGDLEIPSHVADQILSYGYQKGIRLNRIKALIAKEKIGNSGKLLFHGSKTGIVGDVSVEKGESNKDFGKAFYLGESVEQATSFVSSYPSSKLYLFQYSGGAKEVTFGFDIDWVIAICYYRGYLKPYENHPLVKAVIEKIEEADVVIAPIADNQMFDTMREFADGLITDVVCVHCLSASDLGMQYVFRNDKAIKDKLEFIGESAICRAEKEALASLKRQSAADNLEKKKIVMREYRTQGKFVEDIFK